MTDKTLGAYQRTTPDPDETTGEALARLQADLARLLDQADAEMRAEAGGWTADDISRAEFASHPDGRTAMRSGPDLWKANVPDEFYNSWFGTSVDMARDGWTPVRECPDPDEHVLARDYAAMSDRATAWQERAEKSEKRAALWKETARRLAKRVRGLGWERDQYRAGEEEAEGRAVKAEKERDEAIKHERVSLELGGRTADALADEVARSTKAEQERDSWQNIAQQTARSIEALRAESRPFSPAAITDEMVERAVEAWLSDPRKYTTAEAMRRALTAALTEPPQRPAWLDAPAVRAWHKNDGRTEHDGTPGKPRIWSPDYGTTETWSTPSLPGVHWSELVDVEPLGVSAEVAEGLDRVAEFMSAYRVSVTEFQPRPDGAKEIEAYMRELVASHPEDHYGELADYLASRGVLPPLTDKTNPVRAPEDGAA